MMLDLSNEVCPVPLVKARRAMDKMKRGDILDIIITDQDSKLNIIMAAKELGMEIKRVFKDEYEKWHITIRKK